MKAPSETKEEKEVRLQGEEAELRRRQTAKARDLHIKNLAQQHPSVRELVSELEDKDRQIADLQQKLRSALESKSRKE